MREEEESKRVPNLGDGLELNWQSRQRITEKVLAQGKTDEFGFEHVVLDACRTSRWRALTGRWIYKPELEIKSWKSSENR